MIGNSQVNESNSLNHTVVARGMPPLPGPFRHFPFRPATPLREKVGEYAASFTALAAMRCILAVDSIPESQAIPTCPAGVCNGAVCPTIPLTSVTLPGRGARDILGRMSDLTTNATRKLVTAQSMEEAKAAAYANDPQTELVILGLSENAAVTTCGWARRFFDSGGLSGF
jgi:hypothetical protein